MSFDFTSSLGRLSSCRNFASCSVVPFLFVSLPFSLFSHLLPLLLLPFSPCCSLHAADCAALQKTFYGIWFSDVPSCLSLGRIGNSRFASLTSHWSGTGGAPFFCSLLLRRFRQRDVRTGRRQQYISEKNYLRGNARVLRLLTS